MSRETPENNQAPTPLRIFGKARLTESELSGGTPAPAPALEGVGRGGADGLSVSDAPRGVARGTPQAVKAKLAGWRMLADQFEKDGASEEALDYAAIAYAIGYEEGQRPLPASAWCDRCLGYGDRYVRHLGGYVRCRHCEGTGQCRCRS